MLSAAPAAAQVGATVSLFSDYRLRGYSISGSRPVAILDLSYDAPSGLYAGASASLLHPRGKFLEPLGLQVNGGYAKRVSSSLTLDLGAAHASYSSYSHWQYRRSYNEFYAGLAGKILSARLSVSPDYLGTGWTIYGETTAEVSPAPRLHLSGTFGVQAPLASRYGYGEQGNARLGLNWTAGRLSLHAAGTARFGRNIYATGRSSRAALLVGASYAM